MKIGDIVRVKGLEYGPRMIISGIIDGVGGAAADAYCRWFTTVDELNATYLDTRLLEIVPEDER